jgi:cobyrinic acid a,c-diamide synthase
LQFGAQGFVALPPPGQRIAVARDEAFSFLYPHIVAGWRGAGADLLFFSPLADEAPPSDADVSWLPGGYPELHAGRLAAADNFQQGLRRFAETRPVHGECGGYMVLGETLTDAEGHAHPMAGLLPVATSFAKRKLSLGYRAARLLENHPLGSLGTVLRGHEFHYATGIEDSGNAPFADMTDAYGADWRPAGSRLGNASGTFFHVIARDS